jgi:hypothetical protein
VGEIIIHLGKIKYSPRGIVVKYEWGKRFWERRRGIEDNITANTKETCFQFRPDFHSFKISWRYRAI